MVAALLPVLSWAQQGTSGLIVEEIASDSAAAKAGLKLGDRIVSYDNRQLSSPAAPEADKTTRLARKKSCLQCDAVRTCLR
jgi:S1-C subfamily serine protease